MHPVDLAEAFFPNSFPTLPFILQVITFSTKGKLIEGLTRASIPFSHLLCGFCLISSIVGCFPSHPPSSVTPVLIYWRQIHRKFECLLWISRPLRLGLDEGGWVLILLDYDVLMPLDLTGYGVISTAFSSSFTQAGIDSTLGHRHKKYLCLDIPHTPRVLYNNLLLATQSSGSCIYHSYHSLVLRWAYALTRTPVRIYSNSPFLILSTPILQSIWSTAYCLHPVILTLCILHIYVGCIVVLQ